MAARWSIVEITRGIYCVPQKITKQYIQLIATLLLVLFIISSSFIGCILVGVGQLKTVVEGSRNYSAIQ
jgi:hypothetical protein